LTGVGAPLLFTARWADSSERIAGFLPCKPVPRPRDRRTIRHSSVLKRPLPGTTFFFFSSTCRFPKPPARSSKCANSTSGIRRMSNIKFFPPPPFRAQAFSPIHGAARFFFLGAAGRSFLLHALFFLIPHSTRTSEFAVLKKGPVDPPPPIGCWTSKLTCSRPPRDATFFFRDIRFVV